MGVLVFALLLPTTAWAQADYTGTPPPDKGATLTNDAPPTGDGGGAGAEVKGRQFTRNAAKHGSAFDLSDLLLGLPFLLIIFFILFFWLRRRRDEEEDEFGEFEGGPGAFPTPA